MYVKRLKCSQSDWTFMLYTIEMKDRKLCERKFVLLYMSPISHYPVFIKFREITPISCCYWKHNTFERMFRHHNLNSTLTSIQLTTELIIRPFFNKARTSLFHPHKHLYYPQYKCITEWLFDILWKFKFSIYHSFKITLKIIYVCLDFIIEYLCLSWQLLYIVFIL